MRRHALTRGDHLVVIGCGPVAVRLVDELLPEVRAGRLRVTVIGAEQRAGYNRVLVGEYAVGRAGLDDLTMVDPEAWAAAGVTLLLGAEVRWLDRAARVAHVRRAGTDLELAFDAVVFAVGARARVPVLRGLNPDPGAIEHLPEGVTVLRTPDDADGVRRVVTGRGRVLVLGGGVLGLEVALAAHEEGCRVSVVHHRPWLLTRSTDAAGGAMLGRVLAGRGVTVIPDAIARSVQLDETGRFRALALADGRVLPADVLVLACGTTPRTRVAEGAGLRIGTGILVNHDLEADPEARMFAIGDCAEVLCSDPACTVCPPRRGHGPSGLIGPGWQQAAWLARRFAHELDADGAAGAGPLEPLASTEPDTIRLKSRPGRPVGGRRGPVRQADRSRRPPRRLRRPGHAADRSRARPGVRERAGAARGPEQPLPARRTRAGPGPGRAHGDRHRLSVRRRAGGIRARGDRGRLAHAGRYPAGDPRGHRLRQLPGGRPPPPRAAARRHRLTTW